MYIKSSDVVYIRDNEELFMNDIIQEYESEGWTLVLQRELTDDGSDCNFSWILGFARKIDKSTH
jgi:hypothetical protein